MLFHMPTGGPGLGWRPPTVKVPVINRCGASRSAGQIGAFAFDTTRGDAADVTTNLLDGSTTSGFSCLVVVAAADLIHGKLGVFTSTTADNAEGEAIIFGQASIFIEESGGVATTELPLACDAAQSTTGLTADAPATYKIFGYTLGATTTGETRVECLFNGITGFGTVWAS